MKSKKLRNFIEHVIIQACLKIVASTIDQSIGNVVISVFVGVFLVEGLKILWHKGRH